jgi:hypothetical protein
MKNWFIGLFSLAMVAAISGDSFASAKMDVHGYCSSTCTSSASPCDSSRCDYHNFATLYNGSSNWNTCPSSLPTSVSSTYTCERIFYSSSTNHKYLPDVNYGHTKFIQFGTVYYYFQDIDTYELYGGGHEIDTRYKTVKPYYPGYPNVWFGNTWFSRMAWHQGNGNFYTVFENSDRPSHSQENIRSIWTYSTSGWNSAAVLMTEHRHELNPPSWCTFCVSSYNYQNEYIFSILND